MTETMIACNLVLCSRVVWLTADSALHGYEVVEALRKHQIAVEMPTLLPTRYYQADTPEVGSQSKRIVRAQDSYA